MADDRVPILPPALAVFGVTAGPHRGEDIPILSPVAGIGQGAQNEVVLDDDSVSRQHARLEFQTGAWMLTDLESTNGTFIDDVRLAPGVPTTLADGSKARFGGVEVSFRIVPDADPVAALAAWTPPGAPGVRQPWRLRIPLWQLVSVLLLLLLAALFFLLGGAGDLVTLP